MAWDLFQYGQEVLEKVSQPSYSFTVDSADFLVMDEFETFKNALSLGKRVYLKLDNGRVLTPLLLGFSHTFDEESGLTLEFSNKFTSSNENDRLVDLLEQSVSMGKKLDLSRETYAAFVDSHANTAIHDFMNGSLDVAKNMVMSSVNQAITWDENGLRLRKWADDSKTSYDPHQVWMMNENIVFTNDGWQTAKMAIGHIVDDKLGDLWGVVADNLVGKMIAGENMYIYSTKPDGEHMSFTVDGTGMRSWNANQIWDSDKGSVVVAPDYGIIAGTKGSPTDSLFKLVDGAIVPVGTDEGKLVLKDGMPSDDRINVWIGTDGQAFFRGNVTASNFFFDDGTGDVKTLLSEAQKKIPSDYLELFGITVLDPDNPTGNPIMKIDKGGIEIYKGDINWGALDATTQSKINEAQNPAYIQSTYIDATKVESFHIKGNKIEAVIPVSSQSDTDTGFVLTGPFDNSTLSYLRIYAYGGFPTPTTVFTSPSKTFASWDFFGTTFYGNLDFSHATTTGLHFTLA